MPSTILPRSPHLAGLPALRRALILLALLPGCAAPARTTGARVAAGAPPESAMVVVELRMRRSAELADSRGALRVFDQDLVVEYRAGGRGAALDAGAVALDSRPLRDERSKRGSVSYHLGRDEPEGGAQTSAEPWMTLTDSGSAVVPAASLRVKLAPFPVVTHPGPLESVLRTEELGVVLLPPVAGVWYRVSLTGAGDAVEATDLGEGRWLFVRGSLEHLSPGRARVLIEVESSCGDCPGTDRLRASWSSHSELEIPVTLL